jgi:hypothetical protein
MDEYPSMEMVLLFCTCSQVDLRVVGNMLQSLTLPKNIVILLNLAINALPDVDTLTSDKLTNSPTNPLLPINYMFQLIYRVEHTVVDGISVAYFYDAYSEPLLQSYSRILTIDDRIKRFTKERVWIVPSAGK